VSRPHRLLRSGGGYGSSDIGGHVVEPPEQVKLLSMRFDRILGEALSGEESRKLIRSIMESL
jgi:hypothetical protein